MRAKAMGTLTTAAAAALLTVGAEAQSTADEAGVHRAALDYLEGFYEGAPDKIRRGVHPDVVKFGFYRESSEDEYRVVPMSFAQMIEFAEGVAARGEHPSEDAPKEVVLLDVLDQTAAAKVVAWWGTDYLQLARYDGNWKIVHVLWQSPSSVDSGAVGPPQG